MDVGDDVDNFDVDVVRHKDDGTPYRSKEISDGDAFYLFFMYFFLLFFLFFLSSFSFFFLFFFLFFLFSFFSSVFLQRQFLHTIKRTRAMLWHERFTEIRVEKAYLES